MAYENATDVASARQALDLNQRRELQVQAFDTENYLDAGTGTCPRCGHELNIQQTLRTPLSACV